MVWHSNRVNTLLFIANRLFFLLQKKLDDLVSEGVKIKGISPD